MFLFSPLLFSNKKSYNFISAAFPGMSSVVEEGGSGHVQNPVVLQLSRFCSTLKNLGSHLGSPYSMWPQEVSEYSRCLSSLETMLDFQTMLSQSYSVITEMSRVNAGSGLICSAAIWAKASVISSF